MSNPQARFQKGDILWVDLPQRRPPGHEQIGPRPVVVVGLPEAIQSLPYSVLIVVPLTRTRFTGPLFPVLPVGAGGLPAESTALVYQVLALDIRRVKGRIGTLTEPEYQPIRESLRKLFDLPEKAEEPKEKEEAEAPETTEGEEEKALPDPASGLILARVETGGPKAPSPTEGEGAV